MYSRSHKLAIISLTSIYLLINLYNSKLLNISIFLLNIILLSLIFKSKINALIVAYIISILYSIVKNFHLLENFENKQISKEVPKGVGNKIESLPERLINKFIEKTRKLYPTKISTRQVKISDLIPTKGELSPIKIKSMKENNEIHNLPIFITNDNFIIDGHYRWHINKNNNKEFIIAIIISDNINKFLKNINKFKRENNIDELSKFTIDRNKLNKAKKSIKIIMENIQLLNEYQKDLDKINVV